MGISGLDSVDKGKIPAPRLNTKKPTGDKFAKAPHTGSNGGQMATKAGSGEASGVAMVQLADKALNGTASAGKSSPGNESK